MWVKPGCVSLALFLVLGLPFVCASSALFDIQVNESTPVVDGDEQQFRNLTAKVDQVIEQTQLFRALVAIGSPHITGEDLVVQAIFYNNTGLTVQPDFVNLTIYTPNGSLYLEANLSNFTINKKDIYSLNQTISSSAALGMYQAEMITSYNGKTVSSNPVPFRVAELVSILGGGGGVAGSGSSIFSVFDVGVDVIDPSYLSGDKVVADVTLINKGKHPVTDAVMTYYFLDPDGNRRMETTEFLFEPDIGAEFLKRSINLPKEAEKGEWRFILEYDTTSQSIIQVVDSFEVVEELDIFSRAFSNSGINGETFPRTLNSVLGSMGVTDGDFPTPRDLVFITLVGVLVIAGIFGNEIRLRRKKKKNEK